MLSRTCLMKCLPLAASLALACSCASKEQIRPIYPPVADLTVEAKPRLDPAALSSEAALDAHDIAVESWGERGWLAVGRLCRWAKANGMAVACPAPWLEK